MLTASHEEGAQGPLIKELKDIAPDAYAARVRALPQTKHPPLARSSTSCSCCQSRDDAVNPRVISAMFLASTSPCVSSVWAWNGS